MAPSEYFIIPCHPSHPLLPLFPHTGMWACRHAVTFLLETPFSKKQKRCQEFKGELREKVWTGLTCCVVVILIQLCVVNYWTWSLLPNLWYAAWQIIQHLCCHWDLSSPRGHHRVLSRSDSCLPGNWKEDNRRYSPCCTKQGPLYNVNVYLQVH